MAYREINGQLTAAGVKLAIVVSRFNSFFTAQLLKGALDCFERHGGRPEQVTVAWVPGANELPLVADKLAASGQFQALVALGAVIRGDTYHFEVVSNDACRAIMEVQLDTGVPIANGILTCDTDEQAEVRMQPKGADCAQAAVEMANLQKALLQ